MLVWDHRKKAHEAWAWIGAVAAAALLLAALAAPMAAAAPSATTLSDAVVSPRTGTTATTILISVIYRNADGARADQVTATVGDVDHAMTRVPGGDWRTGVTYSWSGKLPIGTLAVVLTARGRNKHIEATLTAGTVKIGVVPAPTPKPTPTPTPKATPKPTPKPTPTAAPRRTAEPTTAPRSTRVPSLGTPTPTPARTVDPTRTPGGSIADILEPPFPWTPTGIPANVATPTPTATPIPATIAGTGGPGDSTGGGSDTAVLPGRQGSGRAAPWGPVAGLFALAGLPGLSFPNFGLGPTLVTTTGVVTAAMAFGLFGRRRRDDEDPPDELMSAAAALGLEVAPAALVGAAVGARAADGSDADGGSDVAGDDRAVAGIAELEALMPRWRRPSLIQARKADPIRDNTPAPRLTFDQGLVGPLDGSERRVIRYRVVRLLDSPDELRGAEIGYLDKGDQVQLLEKYGAYWLVLCPDGRQGWLHKMTLGELVEDDGAAEGPVATMPIAADTWTMGEDDIDGDVFEAYLESRRRRES